jgi:hypothetical protein
MQLTDVNVNDGRGRPIITHATAEYSPTQHTCAVKGGTWEDPERFVPGKRNFIAGYEGKVIHRLDGTVHEVHRNIMVFFTDIRTALETSKMSEQDAEELT